MIVTILIAACAVGTAMLAGALLAPAARAMGRTGWPW